MGLLDMFRQTPKRLDPPAAPFTGGEQHSTKTQNKHGHIAASTTEKEYMILLKGDDDDQAVVATWVEKLVHDHRKAEQGATAATIEKPVVLNKSKFVDEDKYILALLPENKALHDRILKANRSTSIIPNETVVEPFAVLPTPLLTEPPTATGSTWALRSISAATDRAEGSNHPFAPDAGQSTYIYVIDSGINGGHPEFHGKNIERLRPNVTGDQIHGTAVASCIGGRTLGVARGAALVDVPTSYSNDDILTCLVMVHADIIKKGRQRQAVVNMSWGAARDNTDPKVLALIEKRIKDIVQEGVVCVVSSGNNSRHYWLADELRYLRASDTWPAYLANVITVGAINRANEECSFSRSGDAVDIFAPGHNIQVANVLTSSPYKGDHGTSFAAPYVSAVAAIIMAEAKHSLSPEQVKFKLLEMSCVGEVLPSPVHSRALRAAPWSTGQW